MTDLRSREWQVTVTLPVGGHDDPDLSEVTLRKMTGNEEALLAEPRLRANGGRLVTALLSACSSDADGRGLPPAVLRGLTSADRNYLLLELRRLTFGDEMEARYPCPHCRAVTVLAEDLGTVEVRRIEPDETSEVHVELADGYRDPDHGVQRDLVLGLPTGADEEAAGGAPGGNPARQRDALLARCLIRVGGLEPRRVAALGARVLAELSMSDRRLIQQALDDASPGPDLTRTVTCDGCGADFRAGLDMSRFFPLG